MNYFNHCKTLEELKKAYRTLAMINHPDRGGDVEEMKRVNNAYDEMFKLIDAGLTEDQKAKSFEDAPEAFREALYNIIGIDGLDIEICGSWIWVSGNTKDCKDILKASGFRWRSKKVMWSWGEMVSKSRKNLSMDQIRGLHGSTVVKGNPIKQLA